MVTKLIELLISDKDTTAGLAELVKLRQEQLLALSGFFNKLTEIPTAEWDPDTMANKILELMNLDLSSSKVVLDAVVTITRGAKSDGLDYLDVIQGLAERRVISEESVKRIVEFYQSLEKFTDYDYTELAKYQAVQAPYLRSLSVVPLAVPVFESVDVTKENVVDQVGQPFAYSHQYLCTAFIRDIDGTKQTSFTISEHALKVLQTQLLVAQKQMEVLKKGGNTDD